MLLRYIKLAVMASPILAFSAHSTPVVTFTGEVTSQTCSVSINGDSGSMVMLPTVSLTDFGSTLTKGQSAGLTRFTVSVTGCTAPTKESQNITTKFLGYNVDADSGVLGNRESGTNAAKGFGMQIMSSASGGTPVKLSGVTSVPGLVLPVGQTSASYDFGVRYYVIDSNEAKPGAITSVAEYTLSYL